MTTIRPQAAAPSAARPVNGLAGAALISSFFIGVLGIVLGHKSLEQIKDTGEAGRGLAIAALAVGYAAVCLTVLALLTYVSIATSFHG